MDDPLRAATERAGIIIEGKDNADIAVVYYEWTPVAVADMAANIRAKYQADYEVEILERLLYTSGMKYIWRALLAENREKGGFLHPVKESALSADPLTAQHKACGDVLNLAFRAARDRRAAVKETEVEAEHARLLSEARAFRDLADQLAAGAVRNPVMADAAAAALGAALIKEEQVRRTLSELVDGNDPIVIRNESGDGDRVVRGCQITIAEGLKEIFGLPMDRTATRLAQVALNEEKASVQAPRTAVQRQKLLRR